MITAAAPATATSSTVHNCIERDAVTVGALLRSAGQVGQSAAAGVLLTAAKVRQRRHIRRMIIR